MPTIYHRVRCEMVGRLSLFPPNLYARVRFCFAHTAHETARAARTWSSLRPQNWRAEDLIANLGQNMSRYREAILLVVPAKAGTQYSRDSTD